MNSALTAITDQISELYVSANSAAELEQIKSLIKNYITTLEALTEVDEVKENIFTVRNNILHLAAKFGDLEAIAQLFEFVNSFVVRVDFGKAVEFRDMQFYLNLRDQDYFMPIHYAAKYGRTEVVKFLIENGSEISPTTSPKNRAWTPIHYAAKGGYLEIVKLLVQFGVDKEVKTSFGLTPLVVACEFGRVEIVKFLLDKNVDKNVKTTEENYEMTALHYAAVAGFFDVANVLVSAGADLESKTISGLTAIHFAVSSGKVEMVEFFLKNGADRKIIVSGKQDLLSFAVFKDKKDVVELLLKWGVGDFNTALKMAKANSNREIINVITKYQKEIKNLFLLKKLPNDFFEITQKYTKQNLHEANISLDSGVVLNAYAIVNMKCKVGLFIKNEYTLLQVSEKAGDEKLSSELLRLEKLIGLYQA